jgi:hypothetical protein
VGTLLRTQIGGLPPGTPAAFEAAFGRGGWWSCSRGYGFDPHLVHPLRCKAIASARLKNDKADAEILVQLLRADLLPQAWIAPPAVRQLGALCQLSCGEGSDLAVAYTGKAHRGSVATEHSRTAVGAWRELATIMRPDLGGAAG